MLLLNLLLDFAPELLVIDLRRKRFLELRIGFDCQLDHGVVLVDFAGKIGLQVVLVVMARLEVMLPFFADAFLLVGEQTEGRSWTLDGSRVGPVLILNDPK